MRRLAAAWCVLLGSSSAAFAQEFCLPAELRQGHGEETDFALVARASRIAGKVDSNPDVAYEDLWTTGPGLSLEVDFMSVLSRGWRVGAYASGGFDVFGGDTVSLGAGSVLEADDWEMAHLLGGFKLMLAPDKGFFFDARAGLGAVFYGDVDGELRAGGLSTNVAIFESSIAFAGEIGVHFGYSAPTVYVAAGIVGRAQGKPEESKDVVLDGLEAPGVGTLEVEVGFRF